MAGGPAQRDGVPSRLRDRHARLHPAAAVIAARLAAPRRAALLTGLVLGAAALRSLLLPVGDAFSTAIFAACLLGITRIGNPHPSPPPQAGGGGLKTGRLAAAGVALGLLLLLPVMAPPR